MKGNIRRAEHVQFERLPPSLVPTVVIVTIEAVLGISRRVVDDDVETAEDIDRLCDEALGVIGIRYVGLHGLSTRRSDLRHYFLGVFRTAVVVDDNFCVSGSDAPGSLATDAA